MLPDRLNFLSEFDRFYQGLVNDIKEDRYNERDFYLIITAKAKSMNQERNGRKRNNRSKKSTKKERQKI